MCGRYAITLPPEAFRQLFAFEEQPNFPPRYNVAPTQPVPIVREEAGRRHFGLVRWGFLPSWVKDPRDFPLVINARGETLTTKPTFRAALKRRRCIFLADGFYEWQRRAGGKAAFLIRRRDRGPLPLAGLWETYTDPEGGEIDTAAIVTTDANRTLAAVHDRMPVILGPDGIGPWLEVGQGETARALELVRPCPDEWLELVAISKRVNRVENDDPSVQDPVAQPQPAPPRPSRSRAAKPRSSDEDEQGSLF
jgi:putative SOS response-associated peptidase YedK